MSTRKRTRRRQRRTTRFLLVDYLFKYLNYFLDISLLPAFLSLSLFLSASHWSSTDRSFSIVVCGLFCWFFASFSWQAIASSPLSSSPIFISVICYIRCGRPRVFNMLRFFVRSFASIQYLILLRLPITHFYRPFTLYLFFFSAFFFFFFFFSFRNSFNLFLCSRLFISCLRRHLHCFSVRHKVRYFR